METRDAMQAFLRQAGARRLGQHPELVRVLGSWLKRLATAPLCEDLLCDLIRVAATLSFAVLKESGISKILRNLPK